MLKFRACPLAAFFVIWWVSLFAREGWAQDLPAGAMHRLGAHRFVHPDAVRWMSFIDKDRRLFSDYDLGFCIWDVAGATKVWEPKPNPRTMAARVSADGNTVVIAENSKRIGVIQVGSSSGVEWLEGANERSGVLAIDGEGKRAVSGDIGHILVWDIPARKLLKSIPVDSTKNRYVNAVAITRDGRYIAGDTRKDTGIWLEETGERLASLPGCATELEFSKSGDLLACSVDLRTSDTTSQTFGVVVEVPTGKMRFKLRSFGAAGFSPDGTLLATADSSGVKIFDVTTGKVKVRLEDGTVTNARSVAFSGDGGLLACGSVSGDIRLWSTADWKEQKRGTGHLGGINSTAISKDGRIVATGGSDATVRIWSTETGQELRKIELDREVYQAPRVSLSPDHSQVAVWGTAVGVWETATGKLLYSLDPTERSAAFTPDGSELITGGKGGVLTVRNAATGEKVREIGAADVYIKQIVISPDAKRAIWEGHDDYLRIRDLTTGADTRPGEEMYSHQIGRDGASVFTSHQVKALPSGEVIFEERGIAGMSPDGEIVVRLDGSRICLWHRSLKKELSPFDAGMPNIRDVQISADNQRMVTTHRDGSLLVWDLAPALAEVVAVRNRPPVQDATLNAFRAVAAELPFISYRSFLYNCEPRDYSSDGKVIAVWKKLQEHLSKDWAREDLITLADHLDPKIRTLALLKLFTLEQKENLPLFYARMKDNSATFLEEYEPGGRMIGETSIITKPATVGELVSEMLSMVGYPRAWPEDRDRSETFEEWAAPRLSNPDWIKWHEFLYQRAARGSLPADASGHSEMETLKAKLLTVSPAVRTWLWLALADEYKMLPAEDTPLATKAEMVESARNLGSAVLLDFLRTGARSGLREPRVDDPRSGRRFILDNAKYLFKEEDADALVAMGHLVAAADAKPAMASERLRQALLQATGSTKHWEEAKAVAAMMDLAGDREADFVVDWFYKTPVQSSSTSGQSVFLHEAQRRKPAQWRKTLTNLVSDPRFDKLAPLDAIYVALLVKDLSGKEVLPDNALQEREEQRIKNALRAYFAVPEKSYKPLTTPARILVRPRWETKTVKSSHWMSLSPDGHRLAIGSADGGAWILNTADGQKIAELPVEGRDTRVYFQKNGNLITFGEGSKMIEWSPDGRWLSAPKTGESSTLLIGDEGFEDPDNLLATWFKDKDEIAAKSGLADLKNSRLSFHALSPKLDRMLFNVGDTKTLLLWNPVSKELVSVLDEHAGDYARGYFSNDGKYLVTTANDSKVLIWDGLSGKLLHEFSCSSARLTAMAFTLDSNEVVVKTGHEEYSLIRRDTGEAAQAFKSPGNWVAKMVMSPDGRFLYFLVVLKDYRSLGSGSRIECWPLK